MATIVPTNRKFLSRYVIGFCLAAMMLNTPVLADDIADFYHNKTISIYVGFPPGGGYDLYARIRTTFRPSHSRKSKCYR